jgi:ABC-type amino acid transport substrate-binding protein/heat shock protein HslJ
MRRLAMSKSSSRTLLLGLLLLVLIAVSVFLLATCSRRSPTTAPTTSTLPPTPTELAATQIIQDDSWQKVQQTGILRVGTTADYPPFEYYDANLQLDGFDIALIKQIGQRLGLQVELNNFAFDGLPMAVAIGQVDVAIGALSVTPDREAIADFSNVYYSGSDAVLSRPEANPEKVQDPTALAATRLGVQINSIYETYAQEQLIDAGLMPKQNLFVYPDPTQAVNELLAKHIDAVWMDLKPAQTFTSAGNVKILVQDMNQQLYAIGMQKGAESLREKINEALTQLQNDGTLANLQVQYLGLKPEDVGTPQPLPTTVPQPTAAPPACLDGAKWVEDLSYDDKNHKNPPVLSPGQPFTKGWRILNNGTCTWKTSYTMAYTSGNVSAAQMGGQPIPVTREVKPGDTFDFQVNLIAPVKPGSYQGYWNLRNAQNTKFGQTVWVDIIVQGGPTITPKPTQTPDPNFAFTASPTTITDGDPVLFTWDTIKAQYVYFYHDGQKWSEHPVEDDGQSTEYPPYSMNYYLHVHQKDGSVYEQAIWIKVNPRSVNAPNIEYISATPPQIALGLCTRIDWSVKGEVYQVDLLVDDYLVREATALQGNYEDCPSTAGNHVYTLQASGPGGTDTGQTTVSVMGTPVTQEPPPDVATDTPVPPTEPPPPVIEPPVIQGFDVAPSSIVEGECVVVSWTAGGGTTRLELSRDAGVIWTGPELNNSVTDCELPAGSSVVQYTLVAYNNAEEFVSDDRTVQVSPAPPQNLLANTSWRLLAMQGPGDVPSEVSITANFGAEGGLNGSGGCNSYKTSYIADGQVLTIYPPEAAGTLCGDPVDSLEQAYLGLLPQAANFDLSGGQLVVLNNGGQEILRYNP